MPRALIQNLASFDTLLATGRLLYAGGVYSKISKKLYGETAFDTPLTLSHMSKFRETTCTLKLNIIQSFGNRAH